MAKASVDLTCLKCGKEFRVVKDCYNRKDADNWESYMQNGGAKGTCPECWKAEKLAEKLATREKENNKNSAIAENCPWTLPALEGSEKQIAWALNIRDNLIAQMINGKVKWDFMESAAKNEIPANIENRENYVKAAKELLDAVNSKSAKWWIDARGKTFIEGRLEIGRGMR